LCKDNLADPFTVSSTVTAEGEGKVASASCSDPAGNSASASLGVNIDKTPPVITGAPSAAPPSTNWYRGPVSVSFSCTDAVSGVEGGFPTGNTTLNQDTTGTLVSGQCRDRAGNMASLAIGPIRIDTVKPVPQFRSASPV